MLRYAGRPTQKIIKKGHKCKYQPNKLKGNAESERERFPFCDQQSVSQIYKGHFKKPINYQIGIILDIIRDPNLFPYHLDIRPWLKDQWM